MPYAFVAAGTGAPTQVGNSIQRSATFVAGETVLVLAQTWNAGPNARALALSDGVNTWTKVAEVNSASGSTEGLSAVFKADNVSSGTVTLSLTYTNGDFCNVDFNFYRYTGLAPGPALAGGGRNMGPGGASPPDNVTGISLTPTSQPAMLFAGAWPQNDGVQPSASPSSNDRGQLNPATPRGRVEDRRLTSLASVTPAFSTTNNFENHEVIGVIIAEASSGPAQLLRPTSDVTTGAWAASAGGSLVSMIDEVSASDADYIFTQTAADSCTVALQSGNDPLSSTGHIVRYRLRGLGGSGIEVALLQNSTVITTWTHDPAPATFTTYTQTLTGPQADSITNYGALRLRFTEV